MNSTIWRRVTGGVLGLGAVSLLAAMAPIGASSSFAAGSAPPWEPDPAAAAPYGNLVFYNSAGTPVSSGTGDLSNVFAYAVGTTAFDSGADKGTLLFANPIHGETPGNWTSTNEGGPTNFVSGLSSAPTDIQSAATTHPVVATGSGADVSTWLNANVTDTTPGYANTIEVRLTDSGPFGVGNPSGTYWESDIGYNTTSSPITVDGTTVPANGWAELFPFVTATTTTLTSSLTSPQSTGTDIPLKATVSPAEAGTVQFYDGPTALGSPVTVSAGVATYTDNRPPATGSHSYTAVFTPNVGDETNAGTATATFVGGSTSTALPFQINSASVTFTPSTVAQGGQVVITLTGWPSDASVVLHAGTPTGKVLATLKVNSSGNLTTPKVTISSTAAVGTFNIYAVSGTETAVTKLTITKA